MMADLVVIFDRENLAISIILAAPMLHMKFHENWPTYIKGNAIWGKRGQKYDRTPIFKTAHPELRSGELNNLDIANQRTAYINIL